jgi:hypothetical protein
LWAVVGDLWFVPGNGGFCGNLLAFVGDLWVPWAISGIYATFLAVHADIVG